MCHHTSMPECCEVSKVMTENEVTGGGALTLSGNQEATVKFFISGGFGSGNPRSMSTHLQ